MSPVKGNGWRFSNKYHKIKIQQTDNAKNIRKIITVNSQNCQLQNITDKFKLTVTHKFNRLDFLSYKVIKKKN